MRRAVYAAWRNSVLRDSCFNKTSPIRTAGSKDGASWVHLFVFELRAAARRAVRKQKAVETGEACQHTSATPFRGAPFKFSRHPHITVATFCRQKAQNADRKERAAAGCICCCPPSRPLRKDAEPSSFSRNGHRFEKLLRRFFQVTTSPWKGL